MTLYVAFVLVAGLGTLVAARRRGRAKTRANRLDDAHMASRIEDRRRSGEIDYWSGGLF